MQQTWHDLLFAHWPISPVALRPLVPSELPLDTFDGQCWVAVAPFHMSGIRARFTPPVPGVSALPELNVRTYVNYGGKAGVYFFSLDAGSRLAVWGARSAYKLPYFFADFDLVESGGGMQYRCSRRGSPARFLAQYRPTKPVEQRAPGTLAHWLTERYCLYTVARNRVYRAEIHHAPWPLQDAEAEIHENTMAATAGIDLPQIAPLLHFARRIDVIVWPLKKA